MKLNAARHRTDRNSAARRNRLAHLRRPTGVRRRIVPKWRQYHRRNGDWHVVVLRPALQEPAVCVDALLGRRVADIAVSERIRVYGHNAYAHSCRPCNQHELDEVRCLSSAALVSQREGIA